MDWDSVVEVSDQGHDGARAEEVGLVKAYECCQEAVLGVEDWIVVVPRLEFCGFVDGGSLVGVVVDGCNDGVGNA